MKHKRKPTVQQKKLMQLWKLDPADWMVERDTPEEMRLVHRHFDHVTKTIKKKNDWED